MFKPRVIKFMQFLRAETSICSKADKQDLRLRQYGHHETHTETHQPNLFYAHLFLALLSSINADTLEANKTVEIKIN